MLISNGFLKILLKSSVTKRGLNVVFNEVKQNVKFRNINSLSYSNKMMRTLTPKYVLVRKSRAIGKFSSHGYSSKQTALPEKENEVQIKSSFQEMMYARKMQAHRSILVEVAEKSDIPFAVAYFEKYGSIAKIFSYPGERENCFLLLEFSSEVSALKLLSNCGFKNIDDVFPVSSRILQYEKRVNDLPTNNNLNVIEESYSELSFKPGTTISEVIEKIYSNDKLTELDIRLRFFLCSLLKDAISGQFSHCDILPFGSSVNGVGRRGCDLDLVMRLYPDKINGDGGIYFVNKTCVGKQKNLQQKALYRLGEYFLFSPGVFLSDRIMFARVPILKMNHKILNIDFDVSVNNISAVLMSDMLHFCGEIDSRVRPLIHIVKKWAKESNITQPVAGSQISNFGLTILVLFFLQIHKPYPILPPLKDAFTILGSDNSCDFRLQYLKSVDEWKKFASLNKESLASLLKEFFIFLSSYPFHGKIVSLLAGESRTRDEIDMPLYMEYPLDEALNITKNVSKAQYDAMCQKAGISARCLESKGNKLDQTMKNEQHFYALLGIPLMAHLGSRPARFNVNSLLENEKNFRNRKMNYKAV